MNPRTLLHFFQTSTGRFLGFLLVGGMILFVLHSCRPARNRLVEAEPASARAGHTPESQTLPVLPLPALTPAKLTPPPPSTNPPTPVELPVSLSLYSAPASTEAEFGPDYLPFGRLIRCVLVITVDSARIATPILGLVTEDVCRDGRIIIPAGTEVHGRAQADRARDRIASDSAWVIVWPTGEELAVTGLALDQVSEEAGSQIPDGSAGIGGHFIKADHLSNLKVLSAAFLSGATDLFQERQTTVLGSQVLPTAKNAGLGGAHEVVDSWSRQLADSILAESQFVRCAAGKPWYLYTTQAIDKSKATRAGSRLNPEIRRLQTAETKSDAAPGFAARPPASPLSTPNSHIKNP